MLRILICDGDGLSVVEYRLHGSTIEMTRNGGCRDALNENGCEVEEEMEDVEILKTIFECWVDQNYDGDPEENGLAISVHRE